MAGRKITHLDEVFHPVGIDPQRDVPRQIGIHPVFQLLELLLQLIHYSTQRIVVHRVRVPANCKGCDHDDTRRQHGDYSHFNRVGIMIFLKK